MDSEAMTALDDVGHDIDARLNPAAPFSPPSLSASQYKQLELLQHLSLYSELVILFNGEKGMGKTFIAKALIASREDPDQSLMIEADFLLSYLDILHQVAQHIDLAELDNVEALELQIVQRCQQLQEDEQGSFLLIVDNADQLTNEVLLNLNQLALMMPNALHVMFLGMPSLEELLLNLPEPHAPLHTMQTEYLTESESEVVLLEQFPQQDWSGEQVDYMLAQAKGNPGKLMYIAQQLAEGAVSIDQEEQKRKSKFPITHIAAMVLVASVLVVSFLYKNSQTDLVDVVDVTSVENVSTATFDGNTEAEVLVDNAEAVESKVEEEIDFNFVEPVNVPSGTAVASKNSESSIASPVAKISSVESVEETKAEIVKVVVNYSADEQRLLSAKPSVFVTQLFASYAKKSALIFIQDNKSTISSLMYYRTEYKGKPWYVVVSGPFESKVAANAEVAKLPVKLRNQKPWVRSIEPIQVLLNKRS
jgi:DamX protein